MDTFYLPASAPWLVRLVMPILPRRVVYLEYPNNPPARKSWRVIYKRAFGRCYVLQAFPVVEAVTTPTPYKIMK